MHRFRLVRRFGSVYNSNGTFSFITSRNYRVFIAHDKCRIFTVRILKSSRTGGHFPLIEILAILHRICGYRYFSPWAYPFLGFVMVPSLTVGYGLSIRRYVHVPSRSSEVCVLLPLRFQNTTWLGLLHLHRGIALFHLGALIWIGHRNILRNGYTGNLLCS